MLESMGIEFSQNGRKTFQVNYCFSVFGVEFCLEIINVHHHRNQGQLVTAGLFPKMLRNLEKIMPVIELGDLVGLGKLFQARVGLRKFLLLFFYRKASS